MQESHALKYAHSLGRLNEKAITHRYCELGEDDPRRPFLIWSWFCADSRRPPLHLLDKERWSCGTLDSMIVSESWKTS